MCVCVSNPEGSEHCQHHEGLHRNVHIRDHPSSFIIILPCKHDLFMKSVKPARFCFLTSIRMVANTLSMAHIDFSCWHGPTRNMTLKPDRERFVNKVNNYKSKIILNSAVYEHAAALRAGICSSACGKVRYRVAPLGGNVSLWEKQLNSDLSCSSSGVMDNFVILKFSRRFFLKLFFIHVFIILANVC